MTHLNNVHLTQPTFILLYPHLLTTMASPSGHFNIFPSFPREIRLQIWMLASPDPRIIDLTLRNSEGGLLYGRYSAAKGPWFWTTGSTISLPLLQVNHEARNTTLESYSPTSIREKNGLSWRAAYIDFKRDTLYRACERFDPLFQFQQAYDIIIENPSTWTCNTTKLALPLTVIREDFWKSYHRTLGGFQDFNHPDGRKYAIRCILSILLRFPAIKQLFLVIDGRDDQFGGVPEIVEPSESYADYDDPTGHIIALKAISLIVDDLRNNHPNINLPRIDLALFTNGDNTSLERRWYYDYAECQITSTGPQVL